MTWSNRDLPIPASPLSSTTSAYEQFLENRAVVVGNFIMPLGTLDKRGMVPDFLAKVQDAIARAKSEVMG